MFVRLDLGWLEHPFLVNSFLIQDAQQLATLRELGLDTLACDPQRSLAKPLAAPLEPQPVAAPHISAENRQLMENKLGRTGRMAAHRDRVLSIERQYEESMLVTRDVLNNIFREPQQALAQAGTMADQLSAEFLDGHGATVTMVAANKVDDLSRQHALNVMILTLVIAKGMGVSREIMNAAGVGALLHDIGKTSISQTVLRKSPRNRSEETIYRLHGEYGLKIVGEHANPGVRAVIRQHHERVDGSGFPDGCKGPQINPLARLVAIADRFDTLCNPLRPADALAPAEALSTMFAHEASSFDAAMLAALVRELGVYPPGSFVRLNNGSIALVIAANPGNTLKPTLLIYEPQLPRSEAVVLNLVESPELRIDQLLKPAALSRDVLDYLNPRMHVAYQPLKLEV
jgi:putative nucleotidyltransferase with HDIG domain